MADRGFSISSLILSYFLVAGGMVLALIAAAASKTTSTAVYYAAFGAGAFVGGFVAGRASKGSTVLEPAIGGGLVVATIAGLIAATPVGKILWSFASDKVGQFAAIVGVVSIGGALGGSFLSEKLFGDTGKSALPWIAYVAFAAMGACFVAWLVATGLALNNFEKLSSEQYKDKVAAAFLIAIGAGCLLAGLASGASARTRILLASLVGASAGVLGFFEVVRRLASTGTKEGKDAFLGAVIIAIGGGILTLIGSAIGWAAVGKRNA